MTQCSAGHFYDDSRFSACPYCPAVSHPPAGATAPVRPASPVAATAPAVPAPSPTHPDANKTVPMRPRTDAPSVPTNAPGAKTVVYYPGARSTDPATPAAEPFSPVVGWLVCVDGPNRGKDYRLHVAKNFIGRDSSMDVALPGDAEVSRERHAEVIFEPESRTFWLKPGDSSGLVYLNGAMQMAPVQMRPRDIIKLGGTRLMLVPLVDASFDWS